MTPVALVVDTAVVIGLADNIVAGANDLIADRRAELDAERVAQRSRQVLLEGVLKDEVVLTVGVVVAALQNAWAANDLLVLGLIPATSQRLIESDRLPKCVTRG